MLCYNVTILMWRNIANRFLEQEITMPTPLTANQQRVLDALRQAGAAQVFEHMRGLRLGS